MAIERNNIVAVSNILVPAARDFDPKILNLYRAHVSKSYAANFRYGENPST